MISERFFLYEINIFSYYDKFLLHFPVADAFFWLFSTMLSTVNMLSKVSCLHNTNADLCSTTPHPQLELWPPLPPPQPPSHPWLGYSLGQCECVYRYRCDIVCVISDSATISDRYRTIIVSYIAHISLLYSLSDIIAFCDIGGLTKL